MLILTASRYYPPRLLNQKEIFGVCFFLTGEPFHRRARSWQTG